MEIDFRKSAATNLSSIRQRFLRVLECLVAARNSSQSLLLPPESGRKAELLHRFGSADRVNVDVREICPIKIALKPVR